jgi:hypothetical protein
MWPLFPLPNGQTVTLEAHSPGEVVDGFEQPASYGTAVDVEGCGVEPGAPTAMPYEQNRVSPDRVSCTVYAAPGTAVHEGDRATVPGFGQLTVLDVAPWLANPFTGDSAGVVILCGRFDG